MLPRDIIAVDIGDRYIKVLVGNRQRVKLCGLIKTPVKSVVENNLVKIDAISARINEFLRQNKVMQGDISFVIHGNDIFIRPLEMPLMEENNMKKLVEGEITQYLPERGRNYYINCETLKRNKKKEKKTNQILVVATPKNKIDNFIELSYDLGLKLKAIDISANCLARVLRHSIKAPNEEVSVGIIDIGYGNFKTIILDKGEIFIEREIPIGVKNAIKEIASELCINKNAALKYLYNEYSFNRIGKNNNVDKRVKFVFENAFSSFEKIIQFFTRDKAKKSLDWIYITGAGSGIAGVDEYIEDFFDCPVHIIDSNEILINNMKLPENFEFKNYANVLGLLLRKE